MSEEYLRYELDDSGEITWQEAKYNIRRQWDFFDDDTKLRLESLQTGLKSEINDDEYFEQLGRSAGCLLMIIVVLFLLLVTGFIVSMF